MCEPRRVQFWSPGAELAWVGSGEEQRGPKAVVG